MKKGDAAKRHRPFSVGAFGALEEMKLAAYRAFTLRSRIHTINRQPNSATMIAP